MKYRLDKTLRFWVDIELERAKHINLKADKKLLLESILLEFEAAGEAMRYLDAKGNIAWKATPKMLENIADAEFDAEDE